VDLPVCLLVYTPGGPTNFQICFLLFFGQYPKVSNLLIRGERSSFGAQRGAGNKPPLFPYQWILHESQVLFKSGEVISVLLTRIKDRNYKLQSDLFESAESVIK
jgi:hypothetical protein